MSINVIRISFVEFGSISLHGSCQGLNTFITSLNYKLIDIFDESVMGNSSLRLKDFLHAFVDFYADLFAGLFFRAGPDK